MARGEWGQETESKRKKNGREKYTRKRGRERKRVSAKGKTGGLPFHRVTYYARIEGQGGGGVGRDAGVVKEKAERGWLERWMAEDGRRRVKAGEDVVWQS